MGEAAFEGSRQDALTHAYHFKINVTCQVKMQKKQEIKGSKDKMQRFHILGSQVG